MTARLCLLVSAHDERAQRWTRWLRAEGWRVEAFSSLSRFREKAAAKAGAKVALIDLQYALPHPAAALSRLKAEAPGFEFVVVADGPDAFGPGMSETLSCGASDVLPADLDAIALAERLDRLAAATALSLPDGRIRLDRVARQAWAGLRPAKALVLTPTEFELLAVLLEARGRVLRRPELIDRVWPGGEVNPETVDRHVGTLRRKLGKLGARIRTAHGEGYAAE